MNMLLRRSSWLDTGQLAAAMTDGDVTACLLADICFQLARVPPRRRAADRRGLESMIGSEGVRDETGAPAPSG